MKVKLLKKIRSDIRISNFEYGFYDLDMHYNFKWNRQGSYHYLSELLSNYHFIIRYRLNKIKMLKKFCLFNLFFVTLYK